MKSTTYKKPETLEEQVDELVALKKVITHGLNQVEGNPRIPARIIVETKADLVKVTDYLGVVLQDLRDAGKVN